GDFKPVPIAGKDGQTSYLLSAITPYTPKEDGKLHLLVNVQLKGPRVIQQYADLCPAPWSSRAPFAHFDGPFTIQVQTMAWKLPPDLKLVRGDNPTDLRA